VDLFKILNISRHDGDVGEHRRRRDGRVWQFDFRRASDGGGEPGTCPAKGRRREVIFEKLSRFRSLVFRHSPERQNFGLHDRWKNHLPAGAFPSRHFCNDSVLSGKERDDDIGIDRHGTIISIPIGRGLHGPPAVFFDRNKPAASFQLLGIRTTRLGRTVRFVRESVFI
jgi:hypothetical protein